MQSPSGVQTCTRRPLLPRGGSNPLPVCVETKANKKGLNWGGGGVVYKRPEKTGVVEFDFLSDQAEGVGVTLSHSSMLRSNHGVPVMAIFLVITGFFQIPSSSHPIAYI